MRVCSKKSSPLLRFPGPNKAALIGRLRTWPIPNTIKLPEATTIFCAANARTFSFALRSILHARPKRVVVISSTSVFIASDQCHPEPRHLLSPLGITRRSITLPPLVWEATFALAMPFYPNVTAAMGARMLKDMAFDSSPASTDFGWRARVFRPCFQATTNSRAAL